MLEDDFWQHRDRAGRLERVDFDEVVNLWKAHNRPIKERKMRSRIGFAAHYAAARARNGGQLPPGHLPRSAFTWTLGKNRKMWVGGRRRERLRCT